VYIICFAIAIAQIKFSDTPLKGRAPGLAHKH